MMFHLLVYVADHTILFSMANCKSPIAILPMKSELNQIFLIDLFARATFQLSCKVRNGNFCWNSY